MRCRKTDCIIRVVASLKHGAEEILEIFRTEPSQDYAPYEKLSGDLTGTFSRRINMQYRVRYQVLRIWTHYEKQSILKPSKEYAILLR